MHVDLRNNRGIVSRIMIAENYLVLDPKIEANAFELPK